MWTLLLLTALAADPACDPSLPDADGDGLDGGSDCDDCDPTVWVGADELCDAVDNDCDGVVDRREDPSGRRWWWDDDGDGYGAEAALPSVCGDEDGLSPRAGDCDDTNPWTYPGRDELCDDADNDCNGRVDDEPIDIEKWYVDADGDGWGDRDRYVFSCDDLSPRFVKSGRPLDVDDSDPTVAVFAGRGPFSVHCAQAHPGAFAPLALLFLRRRRPAA